MNTPIKCVTLPSKPLISDSLIRSLVGKIVLMPTLQKKKRISSIEKMQGIYFYRSTRFNNFWKFQYTTSYTFNKYFTTMLMLIYFSWKWYAKLWKRFFFNMQNLIKLLDLIKFDIDSNFKTVMAIVEIERGPQLVTKQKKILCNSERPSRGWKREKSKATGRNKTSSRRSFNGRAPLTKSSSMNDILLNALSIKLHNVTTNTFYCYSLIEGKYFRNALTQ